MCSWSAAELLLNILPEIFVDTTISENVRPADGALAPTTPASTLLASGPSQPSAAPTIPQHASDISSKKRSAAPDAKVSLLKRRPNNGVSIPEVMRAVEQLLRTKTNPNIRSQRWFRIDFAGTQAPKLGVRMLDPVTEFEESISFDISAGSQLWSLDGSALCMGCVRNDRSELIAADNSFLGMDCCYGSLRLFTKQVPSPLEPLVLHVLYACKTDGARLDETSPIYESAEDPNYWMEESRFQTVTPSGLVLQDISCPIPQGTIVWRIGEKSWSDAPQDKNACGLCASTDGRMTLYRSTWVCSPCLAEAQAATVIVID